MLQDPSPHASSFPSPPQLSAQSQPQLNMATPIPTDHVPTQAQFLEHGFETYPPNTSALGDSTCSICVEDFKDTNTEAVKLIPCDKCYFHKDCIVEWFKSSHERSGTCPNDRSVLFHPTDVVSSTQTQPIPAEEARQIVFDTFRETCMEVALARYEPFARTQEAITADEIVDAWSTADEEDTQTFLRIKIGWLREGLQDFSAVVAEQSQQLADEMEQDLDRLYARYKEATKTWSQDCQTALLSRLRDLKAADPETAKKADVMKKVRRFEDKLQSLVEGINDPTGSIDSRLGMFVQELVKMDDVLGAIAKFFPDRAMKGPIKDVERGVFDEETEEMLAMAEESRSRHDRE